MTTCIFSSTTVKNIEVMYLNKFIIKEAIDVPGNFFFNLKAWIYI